MDDELTEVTQLRMAQLLVEARQTETRRRLRSWLAERRADGPEGDVYTDHIVEELRWFGGTMTDGGDAA